jgi:hypothetical protein
MFVLPSSGEILFFFPFFLLFKREKLLKISERSENSKKNVSRIRKKTFYLQFFIGTPEGHQKSVFNTPKLKKKQRYIWDLYDKVCKLNPKT